MIKEVEIGNIDLRYQGYRMKQAVVEAKLLDSIVQRGIEEPLEGVEVDDSLILLNGFKRYRCARKLHIEIAPFISLGQDHLIGIMSLLRTSNNKTLSILEQAGFIDELKQTQQMCVAEIATELCRSKAWVSMRLGLIKEMSAKVREKLFSGSFPVYSYMYLLRQFMRMNGIKKEQIEQFVIAVSGKKLSVRDVEQLAHGYFRGSDSFRQQIDAGNVSLSLEQIRQIPDDPEGCSEFERIMLKDLEITQKYMQRVMGKSHDRRLKSRTFHAQANLLTAGILSKTSAFKDTMNKLYDTSRQA